MHDQAHWSSNQQKKIQIERREDQQRPTHDPVSLGRACNLLQFSQDKIQIDIPNNNQMTHNAKI